MKQRFQTLCLLLALVLASPASAQNASDSEAARFRTIITGQMEAFRSGNGEAAYSFASPKIKTLFPTVENFMAMVEKGYPQVWRPGAVRFGTITDELGSPTQRVFITDTSGKTWLALYGFERQPDGTWKINAVRIVETAGEA